MDYNGIICPHCGYETGIEPALCSPEDPMKYCPECDEPLFYTASGENEEYHWNGSI